MIGRLEDQVNQLDRKQRERNLRLIGVQERYGEDCRRIVGQIVFDELNVDTPIETAYRTGRRSDGPPRHIIFQVGSLQDKIDILKRQRKALRSAGYFIVDDLTQKDYVKKRAFKDQIDTARRQGKRWQFRNGRLFVEGKEQHLDNHQHTSAMPDDPQESPEASRVPWETVLDISRNVSPKFQESVPPRFQENVPPRFQESVYHQGFRRVHLQGSRRMYHQDSGELPRHSIDHRPLLLMIQVLQRSP